MRRMAEYQPKSQELVQFANQLKELIEKYGPFELVDDELASSIPAEHIWTGLWLEHQILTNGLFDEPDTYIYMRSHKPCEEPSRTIRVVEIAWYDCPYCEGDENKPEGCDACAGAGNFFVDLDEILEDPSVDLTSEDALWSHRSSG